MGNSNGSKFTTYLVRAIILTFAFVILNVAFVFIRGILREVLRNPDISGSYSPETRALIAGVSVAVMFAVIIFPGMVYAWKLSKKVNFERISDKSAGTQISNFRQQENRQKAVLFATAGILLVMLLFPPFHVVLKGTEARLGYKFIFSPPAQHQYEKVDAVMLLVQCLVVVVIGMICWLALGKGKKAIEDLAGTSASPTSSTIPTHSPPTIEATVATPPASSGVFKRQSNVDRSIRIVLFTILALVFGWIYLAILIPQFAAKKKSPYNTSDRLDNAKTLNDKAIKLNSADKYYEAIKILNKSIELDPEFAAAYGNRGHAYVGLEQYIRAIQDFDRAIELDPEFALLYNGRGNAYVHLGQYIRAIQDFDRAIELDPEFGINYGVRGLIYVAELNKIEQGCADMRKACDLGYCFFLEGAISHGDCL